MVPGRRSGQTMFEAQLLPRRIFPALRAAQNTLKLPLYKPNALPSGAQLERVEVEDSTYDSHRRTFVWQVYRSAENQWLELTQMNWNERFASAGWSEARDDVEAQPVRVSGTTAYLVKRFE